MLGIALGLASSLAWGISDFLGGIQSRRISALTVLLVTQPVGLGAALTVALAVGGDSLSSGETVAGVAAGAVVVAALGAFYRAMALGAISVVSMIGALGVLVPVAAGLIQGEDPGAVQALGAVVAIGGVILVSREPDPEWRSANRTAIGLAAFAALGFGTFFFLLDQSAGGEPAWTIVAARVGGVAMVAAAALYVRPSVRVERDQIPALGAIGLLDVTANSLYAVATNHGLLSLVAIAGSLYSAVTVVLAVIVLGERLERIRLAGLCAALAGVAAIALGSG